jgi:DNA-binding PadR family transcriptional regulator
MNLLTRTEAEILKLLVGESQGLYGLEFVKRSDGKLKRGSIYVLLSRLEDKGYVKVKSIAPAERGGMPRRQYRLDGAGQKVLREYEEMRGRYEGAVHV